MSAPPRSIRDIAREILTDWTQARVNFAAAPYLDAMFSLDSIDDKYIHDDASEIVMYFLSNASSWRGETARRIKLELKSLLKQRSKSK